jgi:predicted RNA polymerase sigma factor
VAVQLTGPYDTVDDDLLSLVFVACHPILSQQSRAALTLRMVGGLATDEIARAFLVPSATMGQRISRAKRTIVEAEVPFARPDADELPGRLSAVLEVVYLIFNEGYAATSGDEWMRRDLAEQAMRLGRMLAGRPPSPPVALENLFPPIPSEVILPLAGFAASQGKMNLAAAIVWTSSARW